jgi:anti-sigma regulatory factor (Ser/Thr protein kinase)
MRAVEEDTPQDVRHIAVRLLGSWKCGERATEEMTLVVSELLTNVHRYAPGRCSVRFDLTGGVLRVAVADSSPVLPEIPQSPPDFEALRGRGLWIVSNVCESFRYEALGGAWWGKRAVAGMKVGRAY